LEELEAAERVHEAAVARGEQLKKNRDAAAAAAATKAKAVALERRDAAQRSLMARHARERREGFGRLFEGGAGKDAVAAKRARQERETKERGSSEVAPAAPTDWVEAYDDFVAACGSALEDVLSKTDLWSTISRWVQQGFCSEYGELPTMDPAMSEYEEAIETEEEVIGFARLVDLGARLVGSLQKAREAEQKRRDDVARVQAARRAGETPLCLNVAWPSAA